MPNFLLTFELADGANQIYVHGDAAGLEKLGKDILELAQLAKAGEFTHDHFSTEDWGGDELSSTAQGKDTRIVNDVTIYGCPTSKNAKTNGGT
jgi:hypothetical protein